MSENKNTTMNGTQSSSCPSNLTTEKIGLTFVYCLIFILSVAGNTVIGVIVYKTKTMRKPINFFIVNMAMSDLLFPIFFIPWRIQTLCIHSWLIGARLGQAVCKLATILPDMSSTVSIQSLVLTSSGSIWCCGISSPFSTHPFEVVFVLHSLHLDRRHSCFLSTALRQQSR